MITVAQYLQLVDMNKAQLAKALDYTRAAMTYAFNRKLETFRGYDIKKFVELCDFITYEDIFNTSFEDLMIRKYTRQKMSKEEGLK